MARNLGDTIDRSDPQRVAVIDCREWDHPIDRTYGDIDREAHAVAAGLLAAGLKPGAAIGICAENRSDYISAFFGIMRAGMVAVPISQRFPTATIEFILKDSGVVLTFCDAAGRKQLPAGIAAVEFDGTGASSFASFIRPDTPYAVYDAPDDAYAMVLYTSGSTGMPKGVPLTHGGHLWVIEMRMKAFRSAGPQRVLVVAPMYHMNALCTSLYTLAVGSTEILLPRFETRRFIEAIERFKCDVVTIVPTMLAMMLLEPDVLEKTDLSPVKTLRMGSAPVSDRLWDEANRLFPGAFIQNAYGTTEAGPAVFGPDPQGHAYPPGACGWPLAGIDIRLVDEAGNDADEGVLWMRSPANSPGYLNLPEKTAAVFTPENWYKSGDIFKRDEIGAFHFVGRADDMFVCGGENIYPSEVEITLELHPQIIQSCVVPVSDDIKGAKPFAFVVREAGSTLTEDDVRKFSLEKGPAYRHPRAVVFLRELPYAGPGKVDRRALQAEAQRIWNERESRQETASR